MIGNRRRSIMIERIMTPSRRATSAPAADFCGGTGSLAPIERIFWHGS